MEDRLLKYFESARVEGASQKEMIAILYGDSSTKALEMPDYLIARKNGLNIIEASLATLLAQDLKTRGTEGLLSRIERSKEQYAKSHFHKKRNRKNSKGEPDLKKKTKL